MKKIIGKNLFARALALALAASLAFPGTALAAAAGTGSQDEADTAVLEQEESYSSETESSETESSETESSGAEFSEAEPSQTEEDTQYSEEEDTGNDSIESAAQDDDVSEDDSDKEGLTEDLTDSDESRESSEEEAGKESASISEDSSDDVQEDAAEAGTEAASADGTASEEKSEEEESGEEEDSTPAAGYLDPIEDLYFYSSDYEIDQDISSTVQLDVSVSYEDDGETVYEGNQPYYFRSGDEKIVTVDENGLVTAVKAGKTNVYVYTGTYGSDDYSEWDSTEINVLSATRTVLFELNGGSWSDSYEEYYSKGCKGRDGEEILLPGSYAVKKDGFKLLGWTAVKNGTELISSPYTLIADTTLYAKWEKLYCVKLDLNGGKWADSSSYYATKFKNGYYGEKGSTAYFPGESYLVRNGYIFKGFTTTKNGTTYVSSEWGGSYTIKKDVTLYAKWAQAVNVTLTAGKGYFGTDKNNKKIVLKFEKGVTVGEINYEFYNDNIPHYGSSAFEGWYKDSALTKPVKRSDVLSKNITYYPKWQSKTYKITVTNLKGASYKNRATGEYIWGSKSTANSYSFYIARGDSIGNINARKDGQELKFYFDKTCSQKPFYLSYVPTGNTTVYAKFRNEVKINWNANGGATYGGIKTGTSYCTKTLMWEYRPYVFRTGYYLVGWVDAAKPSVVLPASHVFTKDTTVKAKWAKGVKVTFNVNGGKWNSELSNSKGNIIGYTKAKAELGKYVDIPYGMTKSGCSFMGWKSSLTKKKVADIYSEKPAKAVTYTAIWSKNEVNVTLMASEGSLYDSTSKKYVTKVIVKVPKNAKLKDVSLKYDEHDESSKRVDFAGWSLKKNGKILEETYKFTKAVTLYPVWKKDTYLRVVLVTNGGAIDGTPDNSPRVRVAKKGDVLKLPTGSLIEREGYTFVGWYADYKCTKKVTSPSKYKVTKTCYLYAKWKKK